MLFLNRHHICNCIFYIGLLCCIVAVSCKSTEKVKENQNDSAYKFHCADSNYFQNADYFRIHKIGESVDQPTSMKKAIQMAQEELAESIISKLGAAIETYINEKGLRNDEIMKEQIFALSYPVSDASINKVNIICEESIKTLNGLYKTYIVLEISVKEVLNELQKTISQNRQFQVKINAAEFKRIFQSEMSKKINEQIFK
jgi:hypothetical protein